MTWMTSLKKAIELRKQNWPTSILNNHPQKNISLFAIDPNGNELYLMFTGLIEPQVISFFGWEARERYDNRWRSSRLLRFRSMNKTLLTEFLVEEVSANVQVFLLESIQGPKNRACLKFTFNRFNVSLDFEANHATIDDDLNFGPDGHYKLGIEELVEALKSLT